MALKIRLTRLGDKGNPFYRVVVAESRSPRDGKFIEVLGTYDPKAKGDEGIKINREVATAWIAKGATLTETARVVMEKAGVLEKETPKKTPTKATPKTPAKTTKK